MAPKAPVNGIITRHVVYLIVMQTIGAMAICFGFNYGLAYLMYRPAKHPVSLWGIQGGLCPDLIVSVLIQQILTWCLCRNLVRLDVHNGLLPPLRYLGSQHNRLVRFLVAEEHIHATSSPKSRLGYIWGYHVKRILVLFALHLPYWAVAVGVVYGFKSNNFAPDTSKGLHPGVFESYPFPVVFKGTYGAIMGLTTPFVAYTYLIRLGEIATRKADVGAGSSDEKHSY